MAMIWQSEMRGDVSVLVLKGELDDAVDLGELKGSMRGRVEIDLAGIGRINSCGVRNWLAFVGDLPGVEELTLTRCSLSVVRQLNMIAGFRGPACVESIYAPFLCDGCNRDAERLLKVAELQAGAAPPTFACSHGCRGTEAIDDLPERLLFFLTR